MNTDLLRNIEAVEKEKSLNRSFMVDILKTGLMQAISKIFPNFEDYDIQIDPITADIKILQNGKEINDAHFSRVAAQAAKQVIFQKIREAELDALYQEYFKKIGNIVSGEIHRFEGQNITIMIGGNEAVLPRREQIYKEDYRQGDYIKAYIVEVRKSYHGLDIILSRTHPFFVKRLFEIEVPEIADGSVEIKGVAREAGSRTKIAVISKDEKIDCVGACVGMRGQRIKNIVEELNGEKIDIIRWSSDPETYIKNALSPSELMKVTLFPDTRRAEVLVNEDQLSLAIGRKGQNIRLGSRLTEWRLDIRTPAQQMFLAQIEGITENVQDVLKQAGIHSLKDILKYTLEDFKQMSGIPDDVAEKIIQAAHKAFFQVGTGETGTSERGGEIGPRSRKDQISAELEAASKQVEEAAAEKPKRPRKKRASTKKAKKENIKEEVDEEVEPQTTEEESAPEETAEEDPNAGPSDTGEGVA